MQSCFTSHFRIDYVGVSIPFWIFLIWLRRNWSSEYQTQFLHQSRFSSFGIGVLTLLYQTKCSELTTNNKHLANFRKRSKDLLFTLYHRMIAMPLVIFQFHVQFHCFLIERPNKRSERDNFISRHVLFLLCGHHVQIALSHHIQLSIEQVSRYAAFSPFYNSLAQIRRFYSQQRCEFLPISSSAWSNSSSNAFTSAVELSKTPPSEILTDFNTLGSEISNHQNGMREIGQG